MRKSLGLRLVLLVSAIAVPVLIWGVVRFDRSATIPLIDRNDPAYAEALFYLDQRALRHLLGRANASLDRAGGDQLQLAREIARARLSQSVYEASIARAENHGSKSVVLLVPAYRWAGTKLERYVMENVLGGRADPALRKRIDNFFFSYGHASQTLTVGADTVLLEGKPTVVYAINHQYGGLGSLSSVLPASRLVEYAPFARLFPAP